MNETKENTEIIDDEVKNNTVTETKIPEKYLPLGSIVRLKEATKSLMIIGYCPIIKKEQLFDYCAVPVPEGLQDTSLFWPFNHEAIEKVEFLGLDNEEHQKWMKVVESTVDNYKKENNK